ncbi:MAG: DUF192 domain-containing protein [Euryarchaeota archaeon]|nr:DUF192 domain-containing protein [Euryarchaeota archaeon]
MQAQTRLLILLVCAMVVTITLSGCVTTPTSTLDNASTISTTMSGSAATKSSADGNSLTTTHYLVTIGGTTVYAEAANTPAEHEMGLMNQTYLNENAGMLFVFPTEQKQSFWMKNMRISLDIIFITTDKHVLDFYQSVPPCTTDPCVLYTSNAPIRYVLEVNAGFSEQHGITSGDTVFITPSS